jgi:hypothetical protein
LFNSDYFYNFYRHLKTKKHLDKTLSFDFIADHSDDDDAVSLIATGDRS